MTLFGQKARSSHTNNEYNWHDFVCWARCKQEPEQVSIRALLDLTQDTIGRTTFLTTLVLLRGRNILVHSTIRSTIDDRLLNRY